MFKQGVGVHTGCRRSHRVLAFTQGVGVQTGCWRSNRVLAFTQGVGSFQHGLGYDRFDNCFIKENKALLACLEKFP